MSNQLMDTLENKVFSAVDTIETLRTEINGLKEERRILEDKLRELIGKMDNLASPARAESSDDESGAAGNSSPSPFGSNY